MTIALRLVGKCGKCLLVGCLSLTEDGYKHRLILKNALNKKDWSSFGKIAGGSCSSWKGSRINMLENHLEHVRCHVGSTPLYFQKLCVVICDLSNRPANHSHGNRTCWHKQRLRTASNYQTTQDNVGKRISLTSKRHMWGWGKLERGKSNLE